MNMEGSYDTKFLFLQELVKYTIVINRKTKDLYTI